MPKLFVSSSEPSNVTPLGLILDQRRISQGLFSRMTGLDQSTISLLVHGKVKNPSWETVNTIATTLGLHPATVFPLSKSKGSNDSVHRTEKRCQGQL